MCLPLVRYHKSVVIIFLHMSKCDLYVRNNYDAAFEVFTVSNYCANISNFQLIAVYKRLPTENFTVNEIARALVHQYKSNLENLSSSNLVKPLLEGLCELNEGQLINELLGYVAQQPTFVPEDGLAGVWVKAACVCGFESESLLSFLLSNLLCQYI